MKDLVGAHIILYSTQPEADRAFLRDILGLPNVDVGDGWLIFGLPTAELAVHPDDQGSAHELFLMCTDVDAFAAELHSQGVQTDPVVEAAWGRLTYLRLPGGGKLGVYQPRHARPPATGA